MLAIAGLKSNKMRSLLTMLGIIIGISSVISIVSIGSSMTSALNDTLSQLGASNIICRIMPKDDNWNVSAEDSGKFIEIARENEEGKFEVKKVPVTTGIETDISVEIESDDLNEGDKLIMDPTLYEEGQIITLAADNGGGTYE